MASDTGTESVNEVQKLAIDLREAPEHGSDLQLSPARSQKGGYVVVTRRQHNRGNNIRHVSDPSCSHAVDCTKAFGASGGRPTSRGDARRHRAIQNTGECAQQLHLCRGGSLIVPNTDDTGRQQA